MAKKILFATGCSYTDKDFMSFDNSLDSDKMGGWKMWPELMAENLGLTCINTGRCGAGADHMFNETINAIAMYGDRIDTVAILWSGADRSPFYTYTLNPLVEVKEDPNHKTKNGEKWDPFDWMDEIGIGKINRKFWASKHFNKSVYIHMIENQLIKMLSIIDICNAKNIKLVMGQGTLFFDNFALYLLHSQGIIKDNAYITKKDTINIFLNNPVFPKLETHKKHFIGWPLIPAIGGLNFDSIRESEEKHYVSELDRHPNADGQKLFSDIFLKKYKELYQ